MFLASALLASQDSPVRRCTWTCDSPDAIVSNPPALACCRLESTSCSTRLLDIPSRHARRRESEGTPSDPAGHRAIDQH